MSDVKDRDGAPAGSSADRAAPGAAAPARSRTWGIVRLVLGLLVLVVLLAMPLYLDPTWLRVGEFVMVSAVAAIGLTMLTGHCGQLSLGTPFFMLIGATVYAVVASDPVAESGLVALGLPPLLALLAAVVVSGLAGLAFAPVAGRVGGIYLSVATLALVYLGLYLGQRFSQLTGGAATGRPSPAFEVLGFSFTTAEPQFLLLGVPLLAPERTWYLFLVFTAIAFVLATGAVRSRPGRAWRAVRDNPASATAMGVDVARTRAGAFVVSSAYAGLSGVMTVMWFGLLKADENEFDGSWSIAVAVGLLAMIIIGGLGSITGAVVGAAFVSGFPLALNVLVPQVGFLQDLTTGNGGFTPVVLTAYAYGSLIVLLVIFEPGGLAAIARRLTHRFTRATTR